MDVCILSVYLQIVFMLSLFFCAVILAVVKKHKFKAPCSKLAKDLVSWFRLDAEQTHLSLNLKVKDQ